MIILSLMEREIGDLRRAILSVPELADAVEVRLDWLRDAEPSDLRAAFRESPRPIIATCRRHADGGGYRGAEARRREILLSAVEAGASFVDLEYGSASLDLAERIRSLQGVEFIVSHHDTKKTPSDLTGLYRKMARVKGAAAIKIATTARRLSDLCRIRDMLERTRNRTPPPIAFSMGSTGILSRVMAKQWGSWAVYASRRTGREAAPGQLSLADLVGIYRIEEIDEETRVAAVIGTPLSHTLSPAIHNAAYRADGLNFRFFPLEIRSAAALSDIRTMARRLRLRGLAVTTPYKVSIMKHLDMIEPLARSIGAVNTVVCDGRRLLGFNTDASAGVSTLAEALASLDLSPSEVTAAVAGSGGAARALAHAARALGCEVLIASRSEPRGIRLARAVGGRHVPLRNLSRQSYDVLVNCTPLGMQGGGSESRSLPDSVIKGRLVYDVVYRPESTALLRKARERKIATVGGMEMLVRQAADQYTLFTGRDAPLDAMREAARLAM